MRSPSYGPPSLRTRRNIRWTVSFNGKTRFVLEVSASLTPSEVEAAVRSDAQTAKYLAGGTVAKVIVVPGRIVNVVVKPS